MKGYEMLMERLEMLQAKALEGCSIEIVTPTDMQVDFLRGVLAMFTMTDTKLPCEIKISLAPPL